MIDHDQNRLELVKALATKTVQYNIYDVRPFYHSSERLAGEIIYYIVPIQTLAMGKVNAHIDATSGKIIAFKGGRGINFHVNRVKRGRLDYEIIAIVDMAISRLSSS